MSNDVQPISGSGAIIAARLCNFSTAQAFLLGSHRDWLDRNVGPTVRSLNGPWIDLWGYASRRGDFEFNRQLSQQRCESVKRWVDNYSDRSKFNIVFGKGEAESGPNEQNNDGYYRAVEIYVFGSKPPAPKPDPVVVSGAKRFKIRVVGGASFAPPALKSVQADFYVFQIADLERMKTCFYGYGGPGAAIPTIIPGPPGSYTKTGPWENFSTVQPASLFDFEGRAQLFQDPGATIGPYSKGGTLRLSIESDRLISKSNRAVPGMIPMDGGSGLSLGAGSTTAGNLKVMGKEMNFTE